MALNSYSALRTSIGDWLNRDDLTAVIPDFISLAEAQMERRLPTQKMVKRANATIDTPFSAVPADFLSMKSLLLTSTAPVQQLIFLTEDELDAKKYVYRTTGKCYRRRIRATRQRSLMWRRCRNSPTVIRLIGC
jgi:hypothetical protein